MLFLDKPLVSIIIPTRNSALTLDLCLKSIVVQTYPNIEIIVVDGYSSDATIDITNKYQAKIFFNESLLGARIKGLVKSHGNFILLLDSDQILEPTCIERAVKMINGYDALILEERSYNATTIVQKLYSVDRRLVHETNDANPLHGVLMPRFYKRKILEEVARNIYYKLKDSVVVYDHAIITYESSKITGKIGYLKNAVYHIEPRTMQQVFRKFYRYGKTSKQLIKGGYGNLLRRKIIPRKAIVNPSKLHLALLSLLLYFLKAIPFLLGYLSEKYEEKD